MLLVSLTILTVGHVNEIVDAITLNSAVVIIIPLQICRKNVDKGHWSNCLFERL